MQFRQFFNQLRETGPGPKVEWSGGCTVLSIAQTENYNRQTADNAHRKSCWDEEKWWEAKFFTDIHVTDVLLAIFTGLLVGVGGWQGWQLRRTVGHMEDTAERQLRAYLSIKPGALDGIYPGGVPSIRFEAENRGKPLTQQEYDALLASDEVRITISGVMDYQDAFGHDRMTTILVTIPQISIVSIDEVRRRVRTGPAEIRYAYNAEHTRAT